MLLIRTALLVALFLFGGTGGAQEVRTVRLGLQATGTFSWVVHAMEHFGIDEELGLRLEPTTYATKQATELALRAGEVDVVVDDFVGAVQMRSRGIPVRAVYPYSRATGGVVVPVDSDIETLEDLRGKTVGAASLDDKSLLILRALTVSQYGFDPQQEGEVLAVAPPLVEELMARGELDAAIPYWHFVARMVGTGEYRDLMAASEMLEALGLSSDLPILVVVARDGVDPETLRTFLRGFDMAVERMREDGMGEGSVWASILENDLYSLPDPALFPEVRARWEAGVPEVWTQETVEGLVKLVEELGAVAGPEVVGVERIDPEAFTTAFAPE